MEDITIVLWKILEDNKLAVDDGKIKQKLNNSKTTDLKI